MPVCIGCYVTGIFIEDNKLDIQNEMSSTTYDISMLY